MLGSNAINHQTKRTEKKKITTQIMRKTSWWNELPIVHVMSSGLRPQITHKFLVTPERPAVIVKDSETEVIVKDSVTVELRIHT